jgi:tRNA(Ile)-lysidine synthase
MRRRRSANARAPNEAQPPAPETNKKQRVTELDRRFAAEMKALNIVVPARIALALSGGGDSISLMRLLGNWSRTQRPSVKNLPLHALIVDHGLRAGSARESGKVAAWARAAGWHAHVLKWYGPKPKANIEDQARKARYGLLANWCRDHKARHLFVGHTRDDAAENFLLRLGRGSGVDGLSAMHPLAPFPLGGFGELQIVRPLLAFGREELRDYLKREKESWLDDPMNDDLRFSRMRARALMPALEAAGISQKRIVDASRHLARARNALEAQTRDLLRAHTKKQPSGSVLVERQALIEAPSEIGLRALSALIVEVSGAVYRPRFARLEALFEAIHAEERFGARTLHGCRIGPAPKRRQFFGPTTIEIKREGARKSTRQAISPN